jgi:hypothetical protein
VAGETPQGKFYQRLSKLPDGALRGFSVSYDKALAPVWDRLTIVAANTYMPGGTPPVVAAAPLAAQPPAPADALRPRTFQRSLTAVGVAPGKALTAAAAFKACGQPRLGGQDVRLGAEDGPSGLAIVDMSGPAAAVPPPSLSGTADAVGILAMGQGADGVRALLALPGDLSGPWLSAPLQPGAAGAPLFNAGGLAGLVVSDPNARLQVAGVVLAARHRVADAAAIGRFLRAQGVAVAAGGGETGRVGLGDIASRHGRSVVAITCGG